MDLKYLSEILPILVAIPGTIAGIYAFYKKVVVPSYMFFKKILIIHEKINLMFNEFLPNHGSTLRDVVDRIDSTQQLFEQKYKALVFDAADCYFESAADGTTKWVNNTYQKMSGLTYDQCMGNGWMLAIPEHERERVFEEWNNAVDQKREFDLTYDFGTHTQTRVHCHAYILAGKDNEVSGWCGKLRKIETD
jgi:PAS domain-containing protein